MSSRPARNILDLPLIGWKGSRAYLPNCPDNTGRPVMPCFCPVEETLPCCNRANPKIALFCPVEHQFCPVESQFCPVEQIALILALSHIFSKKIRLRRANYFLKILYSKCPVESRFLVPCRAF